MAEAVVGALICKLSAALASEAATYGASLLTKEASDLKNLVGEICKVKEELESIKAYLHDSEKFKDSNKTTDIFVNRIRDLAFRIEDVVDEFTYKLEDDKYEGLIAKMRKRIRHVNIWNRLSLQLHTINDELEDTIKRRDRYAIPIVKRYAEGCDCYDISTKPITSCFAREEDLVGIGDNVNRLTQWLVSDLEEQKSKITTVLGMGGVGKTTLVYQVYKNVKVDFDAAAWVTVTKSYQVEDLLKTIAREFGILIIDPLNMEMIRIVEVIRSYLEGKRYILVLDDVWEHDVWIHIMDVFPTNSISRYILTSRNYDVSSLATRNCIIQLKPLEENHSWQLLCNVAFRDNLDKRCPSELQDLATKFLQKCEGLPLAIACIGRLLSCKAPTYSAWKTVYEELELQTTNVIPGVYIILNVSFEDLPYELKNCLLLCALFPEAYEMNRRRLIRHWITSGFVNEKENRTLEQVGEDSLNELVSRNLLQVTKMNEFGRVKLCQMHNVVRRVTLDKAKKECFGQVFEGSHAFSVGGTRRLSIQSTDMALLDKSSATHVRAIYAFIHSVDIDLLRPILTSSNLLSILDLQGTQINMLPNEVFSLFNLRFLGLRYTRIGILDEGVGRLQNLEVLDAFGTALLSLPKDIAKLKKLRFLYASTRFIEGRLERQSGVKVPRGIRNLTGLHALQGVKANTESLCDVAALTKLRTFAVDDVTGEHFLNLCKAIMNMRHLVSLAIIASDKKEVLPLEALCLPETLSKLCLNGQLEKKRIHHILSSWSHLNKLSRLTLLFSKLDEDSFSSITVLSGLYHLEIMNAYGGKKLCFSAQSFPRLRKLTIWGAPQLNQIEIEEGAVQSIVELLIANCPEMKHLPRGIEYLKAIERLELRDTAEDLIETLRQESKANPHSSEMLMKISHIRRVVVELTDKNIRERVF